MPGVNVEIRGDRLVAVTPANQTETVLVIGTAQDGPSGEPIIINSPAQAGQVYGPADYSKGYLSPVTSATAPGTYAGATLPLMIQQAFDGGAKNVIAVRAGGVQAAKTLNSTLNGTFTVTANYAGRIYNQCTVALGVATSAPTVTLSYPSVKSSSSNPKTYTFTNAVSTLADVVTAINADQNIVTLAAVDAETNIIYTATRTAIVSSATRTFAFAASGALSGGTYPTVVTVAGSAPGSLITDGVVVGDILIGTGSATATHNQTFTVTAVSETSMTVTSALAVVAATDAATAITLTPQANWAIAAAGALTGGTDGCIAPGETYASDLTGLNTLLTTDDTGIYAMIVGRKIPFSVATIGGLHIDDVVSADPTYSPLIDFALFLYNYGKEVQPAHGVMGVRPNYTRTYAEILAYSAANLEATTSGYYNTAKKWSKAGYFLRKNAMTLNDPSVGIIDLGSLVSAVSQDVICNHADIGDYRTTAHGLYAAGLSATPPQKSIAKSSISGVKEYGQILSGKKAKTLARGLGNDGTNDLSGGGGFVVFQRNELSVGGAPVIYDDPTCSARDYSLRQHQIVHLCNSIQQTIKYRLFPFLSNPYDEPTKAAMSTSLINVLDAYANIGGLRGGEGKGYLYNIYQLPSDVPIGKVRVDLRIWPAYAIRDIFATLYIQQ